MFEFFKKKVASAKGAVAGESAPVASDSGLRSFLEQHAGSVLLDGMYRVVTAETRKLGQEFVEVGFPHLAQRVEVFGSSWLGDLFCLDSGRMEGGAKGVLLLEPGTGKELKIPANLVTFHDKLLVENSEAVLARSFYEKWIAQGGAVPLTDQCIGYTKPLFLGGADVVENLEVADLDVYWTIAAQLIRKARGLPVGTRIDRAGIL
jgi:hypothetical protein